MNEKDVLALLERLCRAAGGVSNWSISKGLPNDLVWATIAKRRRLTIALLDAMNVRAYIRRDETGRYIGLLFYWVLHIPAPASI